MSQVSDYSLANQGFSAFRTELNNILGAINTLNAGSSAPGSIAAGSLWLGFKCLSMGKVEGPYEEPKPILKQSLTNEQIKSLAESYNRRIYTEIANLQ